MRSKNVSSSSCRTDSGSIRRLNLHGLYLIEEESHDEPRASAVPLLVELMLLADSSAQLLFRLRGIAEEKLSAEVDAQNAALAHQLTVLLALAQDVDAEIDHLRLNQCELVVL